jgi:hypothetical protein
MLALLLVPFQKDICQLVPDGAEIFTIALVQYEIGRNILIAQLFTPKQ